MPKRAYNQGARSEICLGLLSARVLPKISAWAGTVAFGLLAAPLLVAQPFGSELEINELTAGDQQLPDIAVTAEGGFLVVWQGESTPGDDGDLAIIGRWLDSAGQPTGNDFQVNSSTTFPQRRPRIASRGDGSFVVAWETGFAGGKGTLDALATRRFDSTGTALASELVVFVEPNIYTRLVSHDVGATTDDGFVVVHADFFDDSNGTYTGSAGRRSFDSTGSLVSSGSLGSGSNERFVARLNGDESGFVVAWARYEYQGTYSRSRLRRLDGSGAPLGREIIADSGIDFAGGTETDADFSSAGEMVVVWNGYEAFEGSANRIYGRRVDSLGVPDSVGPGILSQETLGFRGEPRVGRAADGSLLVTWFGIDGPGDEGQGLRGRWMASDGSPLGQAFAINEQTTGHQRGGEVVGSADGQFFYVVWQSEAGDGADTDGWSIRGRRVGLPPLFGDGFESGSTVGWSQVVPPPASPGSAPR